VIRKDRVAENIDAPRQVSRSEEARTHLPDALREPLRFLKGGRFM